MAPGDIRTEALVSEVISACADLASLRRPSTAASSASVVQALFPDERIEKIRSVAALGDGEDTLRQCFTAFQMVARDVVKWDILADRSRRLELRKLLLECGVDLQRKPGGYTRAVGASPEQRGQALGLVLARLRRREATPAAWSRCEQVARRALASEQWAASPFDGSLLEVLAEAVAVPQAAPFAALGAACCAGALNGGGWRWQTPATLAWLVHGLGLSASDETRAHIRNDPFWSGGGLFDAADGFEHRLLDNAVACILGMDGAALAHFEQTMRSVAQQVERHNATARTFWDTGASLPGAAAQAQQAVAEAVRMNKSARRLAGGAVHGRKRRMA